MSTCRNCGQSSLRDLGFIGALAPFFLKRVFRSELTTRVSPSPFKRLLQKLTRPLHSLSSRIHPPCAAVELQICLNCSFLQTASPFPEEAIGRLYTDYRSDSYNRERSLYEPDYTLIAEHVGNYLEAGLGRVEASTHWLKSRIEIGDGAMLDFGGADGRFLPSFPGPKYVYEVSAVAPAPGVLRISNEESLQTYPYVQLSHVLEHVPEPLELTRRVAQLVQENGFLFVEVPHDLSPQLLDRLRSGKIDTTITIHEHINAYSLLSIQKLLEATGLDLIEVETFPIDGGWSHQVFIRGLARRPGR